MATLTICTRIANAFAVLFGKHGDITEQANNLGCSRQTLYDHADKVQQDLAEASLPGPSRSEWIDTAALLEDENRQLWDGLDQSFDCPKEKLQQFATTATAMGLSYTQTLTLLTVLIPVSLLPSRATLGRWVLQQAKKASALLKILDRACQSLVVCLAIDEIFFRRQPVLMGIEPVSFAWVMGQRTADRSGATWAEQLKAWPCLQEVLADGGTGIEKGLELAHAQRSGQAESDSQQAKEYRVQLDVFHFLRDGKRALRVEWSYATKVWEEAEKLQRAKDRYDRTGKDRRHFDCSGLNQKWQRAEQVFEEVCRKERAFDRVRAALRRFKPDGTLNTKSWARAELEAAANELTGPRWNKVLRQMRDPRLLEFLEVLREKLEQAEPDEERRELLLALWQMRPSKKAKSREGNEGAEKGKQLLRTVLKHRLGAGWKESYAKVREALQRTHRASSAVECVNSVVRMHQSRHKNLSQELLDLKRLYWNFREFREGKRKGKCPYELLGLKLPSDDPWYLLQCDPAQLTQQLSSKELAL